MTTKADDELLKQCVRAMVRAFRELNEIRARDGVPYTHMGYQASVDQDYFSSVVDGLDAAVRAVTGKSAHCHPLLYERNEEAHREGEGAMPTKADVLAAREAYERVAEAYLLERGYEPIGRGSWRHRRTNTLHSTTTAIAACRDEEEPTDGR